MGDAHNETLDVGHDNNEETDLDYDEYDPNIGGDTNAGKDKEDDDGIYSLYLIYIFIYL